MDDASRLVSELQQKLSELDQKVWQYRKDMASDFNKYAEDVLRGISADVSEAVHKAIAESMKDYKSLNPDGHHSIDSCAGNGAFAHRVWNEAYSYFNTKATTSDTMNGQEVESPRSPHEREKEFQGVFTPSYLPLLDSTSRNEGRPGPEAQYSTSIDPKGRGREMVPSHADASTDTRSLARSPEFRRPDTPRRKNTDEGSVASDSSDGPVRRSALRRSSNSSKGLSPRRVRFDVEGEEVLPTASPIHAQSLPEEEMPPTLFESDSEDEGGSEQVEDIDDIPPKRISSSQALRALSRGPLEDSTQWTTVCAPPDGSPSVPAVSAGSEGELEEDLPVGAKPSVHLDRSTEALAVPTKPASDITPSRSSTCSGDSANDVEIPSDDEMLDMPTLKLMRDRKSAATNLSPIITDVKHAPTAAKSPPIRPSLALDGSTSKQADMGEDFQFLEDSQEDLFNFDDTNDQGSSPEEENPATDFDSPVSSVHTKDPININAFSRSPPLETPRPTPPKPSSTPSRIVVGSYKGRPLRMPIVSDDIHAQAASLGAINSFVGSVNGRSGLDESDVQSYRASGGVGSFSGTPRSMTERLMIEEMLEAKQGTPSETRRR
jgi:hypothetical protein